MKTLKFKAHLVPRILNGTKTVTWRIFDDKDLQAGDEVEFINKDTLETFGRARITEVEEKPLGEIGEKDFAAGHERYASREDMIAHYRQYYGDKVEWTTPIKLVKFTFKPLGA